uniref:Uncharacterized protein n=1 Tax=Anguilla anguilla TaxID=7936 RepID=A0A0E9UKB3_ANGAN
MTEVVSMQLYVCTCSREMLYTVFCGLKLPDHSYVELMKSFFGYVLFLTVELIITTFFFRGSIFFFLFNLEK